MKVLVVGGGGREHAFVDKLGRDDPGAALYAAPGNPGIAETATCVAIPADDVDRLVGFARREAMDLTVVGPEAPLAAGLVDRLEAAGLPAFGPRSAAARLESSKAFAKRMMESRGVPTAAFEVFVDAHAALDAISRHAEPLVVKASGLAAGKGAIVCRTRDEARTAVEALMIEGRFGEAGREVVIEEFMEGIELSVFFLCDGERAVPLLTSRDYKRIGEGDSGLNTGGMGAYAPAAPSSPEFLDDVRALVADPILDAMAEGGTPYRGFLYAGLMLTHEGPRVVEFNCRMGDPETQAVLPLTRSSLLEPMLATARGESLGDWTPAAAEGAALVTVLAGAGYPESSDRGRGVRIPAFDSGEVRVYHAGTERVDGRLLTSGGRVLSVVGFGATLEQASERSRRAADGIEFEGMQFRSDIGWHELERGRVDAAFAGLL